MNEVLIGISCSVIGAVIAIAGFIRIFKKDTREEAASSTKLETKIDYISRGVDDIRIDIKAQDKRINDLDGRLIRVEESTKSAHHRIDGLEKE
jgi:septal ring factor EnvC (AmiA/AmiB activator)